MKKIAIATLAVATLGLAACGTQEAKAEGVSAIETSPYVGMERETEADSTILYLGTEVTSGALTLGLQADLEAQNDQADGRGDLRLVNVDATYAVSKQLSVYAENDFTSDFDRTETKLGFKYNF